MEDDRTREDLTLPAGMTFLGERLQYVSTL